MIFITFSFMIYKEFYLPSFAYLFLTNTCTTWEWV